VLTTVKLAEPQAYVEQLRADDYVLCMTMGHKTDRPILQAIFERRLSPRYLGAIGSRSKQKVLLRELTEAGIPPEVAQQFRCPMGLPLGTNHPGEIAVSVAAELIQARDAVPSENGLGCR
jgi:xanthine dehydrogenase accessory factor